MLTATIMENAGLLGRRTIAIGVQNGSTSIVPTSTMPTIGMLATATEDTIKSLRLL
jgi:hypothetical protein